MKNAILAISERKETLKQIRKELSEQYEIITFNNLLDALDMLRESDFDIILLDEYLTERIGKRFCCCRFIRKRNRRSY